jgi:hypothetical protein
MFLLVGQHAIENLRRLLLIGVRLVVRRGHAEERERVEDRRLAILRMIARHRLHRAGIRAHARRMIELVEAVVEGVDGVDERLLAIRLRADLLRFLRRFESGLQLGRRRRSPDRMEVRHGHAPPGHAARFVRRGRAAERLLRLGVPERMNEREAAVDFLLRRRVARRVDVGFANVAEVVLVIGVVRVRIVRERDQRNGENERCEQRAHDCLLAARRGL